VVNNAVVYLCLTNCFCGNQCHMWLAKDDKMSSLTRSQEQSLVVETVSRLTVWSWSSLVLNSLVLVSNSDLVLRLLSVSQS